MITKAATISELMQYKAWNNTEQKHLEDTIAFIEKEDEFFSRENPQGHLTASAWVCDKDMKNCILIHHPKLNIWVQAGGHIENDESILLAALREAQEETGIKNLNTIQSTIFDIDVHWIPEKKGFPEHRHFDIRYMFTCDFQILESNEEIQLLKWIPLDEVQKYTNQESVLRMVEKLSKQTL